MTEYQIQTNTLRCAVTGRELCPGERFYTVLLDEGGKFLRRDYGADAWTGAPPNAFGFWAGRVPARDENHRPRIDDELLMECFKRLEDEVAPDRVNFRYVVALLLMRRKRLRFQEATIEDDVEVLQLRCVRGREVHRVVNPRLGDEEMAAVQEEVFKVLGWE